MLIAQVLAQEIPVVSQEMGAWVSDNFGNLVRTGVVLLGYLVVWWLLVHLGQRSVGRMVEGEGPAALERRRRVETLWQVLRRMAVLVLVALLVLTVMTVWEISAVPLVAVGSAIGLAVGFGAQSLVKDVIAGFFILMEDQYAIGDVVRIADIAGQVQDIQLRVTVLRDLDGNVHYIPNGEITVTSNFTQEFGRVVADIGVAYKEEVDRVIEVLADEAQRFHEDEEWGMYFPEEPTVLGVDALGDSAVVVRVMLTVAPPIERWKVKREFLRRIKNRLDREGIEIPFPHRTLYLGGPEWAEMLGGDQSSSSTPTTSSTS